MGRAPAAASPVSGGAGAALGGVPQAGAAPSAALLAGWGRFRQDFLRPEGRVVDTGNQNVSHSEGQGWAMFCAERAADRASFELAWGWTRRWLTRPQDRLAAWRYIPDQGDSVPDRNNATDGDLFIAAALLLAGRRWQQPGFTEAGAAIARDILRLLLRQVAGSTLLLPAQHGFETADSVTVNPSYYAFPILGVLARAVPDPAWLALAGDGLQLLRRARFGRWGLPPDWLSVARADGALSLPGRWPPRFSYDAVRVPLYLCWAGLADEPAALATARFWSDPAHRQWPAWVDLATDRIGPYAATPGLRGLAGYVLEQLGQVPPTRPAASFAPDDYYSSVLRLLTLTALSEKA
ncbi:glycosyl hydrolase family 8 [Roseomonas sp. USHLN139]|uniref:glycosyl hydrolase family 8 n=1 Tax=Roseomonas sp. USHLN139 TaxID=3081298 RepID=UPI003B01D9D7